MDFGMRGAGRGIATVALAGSSLTPATVFAQSVADNVTLQSDDAFGRSVGGEKTGLYTSDEVRGFNPVEAGNARVDGMYIDLIDRLPGRLRPGETVRVGLSAQRFPFPAPTGLADFELVKVGDRTEGHVKLELAEFASPDLRVQYKLPLDGERLGLFAGAGMRFINRAEGEKGFVSNMGLLVQSKPSQGASIVAFAGLSHNREDEARPTVFVSGNELPPEIPRRKFLGQYWADRGFDTPAFGAIAKLPFGSFRLETGLFHMQRDFHIFYADILSGVSRDGSVASRTIIADGGNVDKSLSGEARLVYGWGSGRLKHNVTLGLRGRHKQRLFGGSQTIPLGPSSAVNEDFRPAPAFTIGPKSHDDVKQLTYGLAYNLYFSGRFNLDASLSKTTYRKALDFADPGRPDTLVKDSPVLWNVAASLALTKRLTLFAGASRGQEEALIAPDIASNRDEAPPAIRTRQVEAGLRYALAPHLGLVASWFKIEKPYFNLDSVRRFRQLGDLRYRGIELSLTGQIAPGLNLVAGTLLLDPRISGPAVTAGDIGPRPVGQVRRRSVANLDWRPGGGKSAWSFDLALESFSARMGNAANTVAAPGHGNVNLGARYRFVMGGARMLLRGQVINLFDAYGWNVTNSGGFTYVPSRTARLELLIDF